MEGGCLQSCFHMLYVMEFLEIKYSLSIQKKILSLMSRTCPPISPIIFNAPDKLFTSSNLSFLIYKENHLHAFICLTFTGIQKEKSDQEISSALDESIVS